VPAYDFKVYLEFGHRVVAGFVSLGFLGLWAHLYRSGLMRSTSPAPGHAQVLRVLFPVAAVVLLTQVILGGLTVLELLAEWTVASHLVTGNTFCTMLLLIALTLRDARAPRTRSAITWGQRALAGSLVALVPAQIILGGLVSGSHAGLVCASWPSCNGAAWFPSFSGLVGLQVMHRITAYTLALVVLGNLAAQWNAPSRRTPAWVLVGLVFFQVSLGIANVLLRLPMEITLAHSAGAAGILLTTGWLNFEAWAAPAAQREEPMLLAAPAEAK
jgi:cytochrome c oxidase assembly protein subunit 15